MTNLFRKFALAFLAVTAFSFIAAAQTSTSYDGYSPYSLFGIGVLENTGDQNSAAMGGIGIGMRNNSLLNLKNPAAVTARDEKTFMLNFGLVQKNIYYTAKPSTSISAASGDNLTSANNIFNIHHIALSFPIYKSSAMKFGIMPYSSTGYKFKSVETRDEILAEMGDVQYGKQGQGGIYQAFAGAGVTFFDRLSIGADAILYFGTIDRYSSASFTTDNYFRSLSTGWEIVGRGIGGKLGIQYRQPLGNEYNLTVGGTYKLKNNLNGTLQRYAYGVSSSTTDTLYNDSKDLSGYVLPAEVGAGFSLSKNEKWTLGFDWTMQDWSGSTFEETPGVDISFGKAMGFNAGFEYTPNKYDIRYYMRRATYRGGAYYNRTYMVLGGEQIANMGITFGLSLPIFYRTTSLALAVDLGQTGTLDNNLMRERYIKFTIGLNLTDIWFQKSLYN